MVNRWTIVKVSVAALGTAWLITRQHLRQRQRRRQLVQRAAVASPAPPAGGSSGSGSGVGGSGSSSPSAQPYGVSTVTRVALADFPPLKNDRIIATAFGKVTDRVPVWAMRQAGRYLPEFRELRSKADFFTMCRTPELACEATLQPLRRFPTLDAVIIFSDILIVPQAMDMIVEMHPSVGPVLPNPLVVPADMSRLNFHPDIEKSFAYLFDAINLTRQKLGGCVPLIGFTGGPWTLMAYMVEGKGSKTFQKAKSWLYKYPDESMQLLQGITDVIVELLVGQAKAGAQVLQVFESWSGELSPTEYMTFLHPCLKEIASRVRAELPLESGGPPLIVFPKGAHFALEALADTQFNVVGLDWTIEPSDAVRRIGSKVALQGNLDPCVLYAPHDIIREQTGRMLASFGANQPLIANLGHGMHPDHDPEALRTYIEAAQSMSANMRSTA